MRKFENVKIWKRTKKKNIHTIESGENSITKYLTKPKTLLKIETNTHNEHQEQLPHKTEYSQGSSGETIKTREKPEAIHSPTNATKQHNNYSEQGCKPETSL